MQVSNPNNVKIYNLSAGKSLPEVSFNVFGIYTIHDIECFRETLVNITIYILLTNTVLLTFRNCN